MGRLLDRLYELIAEEQDRLFLWVPVLFGAGIGGYFLALAEPPIWPLVAVLAGILLVVGIWREGLAALVVGGALFWLAAGVVAARISSGLASAPVLERPLRDVRIDGWIEQVEQRVGGDERITVYVAGIEVRERDGMSKALEAPPRRLRVRVPGGGLPLVPGDAVRLQANLIPPGAPVLPGAYDFGRAAWFHGLGAVGFSRVRPVPVSIARPMPWSLRLWGPVERLRHAMGQRIRVALPGETGAIASALITGERGGISEATNSAYRNSGIFHILSISGLHMTVFAGALFFAVRFLLSLVPTLALAFEIKKWAAVAGLAGTIGYLMISGGSPPAVRSAIMIGVMFLAVLLDRPALALRNVALAALIILVFAPESLIDVGFQMSFAAVVALISSLEAWQDWRRAQEMGAEPYGGPLRRGGAFLGGIVVTTLIATAAVAPFAAYTFHKSTQYGVLANLVAIPICNLVVMPAALATLVAMPLGLEAWPLSAMGAGIDGMTAVAQRVSALPGAVVPVREISWAAFLSLVGGGIWLALWRSRLRLAGLGPVLAGLALALGWPPRVPDVLVSGGGQLVAARGTDGRYAALDQGRSGFELARWLEHDGDGRRPEDVGPGGVFVCDEVGCTAKVRGNMVAIARHASALVEDCRRAVLVIWLGPGSAGCESAARVVTRDDLERQGTHVIFLAKPMPGLASTAGGAQPMQSRLSISIETVERWRGRRPWSRGGVDGSEVEDR